MKRLNEITIADLMPDSISGDAQVSATARAIDPQLRLISEAVDRPLILAAIDDLSVGVLEHLAVQYDVTSWDSAWPIETKRAVLKTAIADKRKKGTRGAVERAIEAVAPIATLTEWWQDTSGDMPPHTFKIDLLQDGSAVGPETQANVIAQVEEAKPVRSHYAFRVGQLLGGDLYFAGVLRAISYARVRSAGISIEQTNIDAGVLAALRGMSIRRLLASSHMGEMPEPTVVEQYRYGIMGTDSESTDLILFDETEFDIMQSTGVQQSYGEFIDDAGMSFVMSQNELMESTGIQQSYGEFIDDAGLSFVISQNELMEIWNGVRVQEYNLLDATTSKLSFSSASELHNILIPLHSLPDSGLSDPTPPPPEYEDLTLYLPTGTKYYQYNATSGSSQITNNVYILYSDLSRTNTFMPDLNKLYKIGHYDNSVWVEDEIQNVFDLPDDTTGNSEYAKKAKTLLNSGYIWLATNFTTPNIFTESADTLTFRVYPDDREWTTETLYVSPYSPTIYYDRGCTCYTAPIPSGYSNLARLYTDSEKTTRFYYDLDKDYRQVYEDNGSFVISKRQSIWDLPTTNQDVYSSLILKTGELWPVTTSDNITAYSSSTVMIQSAPKQYDEPTITLDLGLRGDLSSATFSSNDYWFSALRNPLDKQKAIDFGVDIVQGSNGGDRISATIMDHFNVELVALCDAYENTVTTDMSNFFASTLSGTLIIRSNNAYATPTNYWRVRITKKTT